MLRFLGRVLFLGLVAAGVYALWKKLTSPPTDATDVDLAARPAPAGIASIASEPSPVTPWVEPDGGTCPASHPVKAKLASGIFHVPGGQNYERTNADRCYVDAPGAEADGLRRAKR
jgi:hypothetical protein